MRNTMQRDITYSTLKEMSGHPTADDIYQSVHSKYPSISKATVYRNLSDLEKMNLIRRVKKVGEGSDRFDKNMMTHFHAKCSKCGKIYDVKLDLEEDLINNAKMRMEDEEFSISSYELVFIGTCSECSAKE